MPKITIKLHDLKQDTTTYQEFNDESATIAFLRARPQFIDVLGVAFEGLTPEQNDRLKAAMRPLDAEERAAEDVLLKARAKVAEALREAREKEEATEALAENMAAKQADPNRLMEVRYHYDGGITLADRQDKRVISDDVRAAVLAWVAERNEWVEDRGQIVGEAKVSVWPGALPKPGQDRVQGGTFIPVTAPPKSPAN